MMVIAKRYEVEAECPKTGNPAPIPLHFLTVPESSGFPGVGRFFRPVLLCLVGHKDLTEHHFETPSAFILRSQIYSLPEHMREELGKILEME